MSDMWVALWSGCASVACTTLENRERGLSSVTATALNAWRHEALSAFTPPGQLHIASSQCPGSWR